MLRYLLDRSDYLAVLYYTKGARRDQNVLNKMENIGKAICF